jgi:CheY-like chemotaxis protein
MMRKKLLLAEDSVTIQKVFELAFEKSEISVIPVDNGDDAVRMAAEIAPDLVVADVTLPGKDGFEVASAILEGGSGKEMPVLILSGTQAPFDEEKFKSCGAHGVLFKPFETRELLEKVEGLVGKGELPAAEAKAPEPPPPADERWDFSDVLDEVEETIPAAAKPDVAAGPAEEAFAGELVKAGGKDAAAGFDEFDVSIEDIEKPAAPEIPAEVPAEDAALAAPAPAATETVEEFEEIEELEEIAEEPEPAAEPEAVEIPVLPDMPEDREERTEEEAPAGAGAPAVQAGFPAPPAAAGDEVLQAELRERFISRAEVIFREVASEAVEKVMWEMMERLTGEFSAKIRESVETVAWEVIPATAEALIREEISRIRTQAGKPISS